jgi:hypothetical protein
MAGPFCGLQRPKTRPIVRSPGAAPVKRYRADSIEFRRLRYPGRLIT